MPVAWGGGGQHLFRFHGLCRWQRGLRKDQDGSRRSWPKEPQGVGSQARPRPSGLTVSEQPQENAWAKPSPATMEFFLFFFFFFLLFS